MRDPVPKQGNVASFASRRPMTAARAYLDHNATSPVRPEVRAGGARALTLPGNPSSVHAEGRAARAALEAARDAVAALVGAPATQVTFTSGGTEAAQRRLSPARSTPAGPAPTRLLIGATEHPCVLGRPPLPRRCRRGAAGPGRGRHRPRRADDAARRARGRGVAARGPGRQQRDRGHPAAGGDRRPRSCGRRAAHLRCGAGGRQDRRSTWRPSAPMR